MTPEQLSEAFVAALADLVAEGAITLPDGVPSTVLVERPKVREHGDYATNVALQLGKKAGLNPREFAGLLAERLSGRDDISSVEVAGPGFLNVRVAAAAQGTVAEDVVRAGAAYGTNDASVGQRINLEFISANPTGPLHLGHTRWAAVGDALARVLRASGAEVSTEFYINDRGSQMDKFGASLMARAQGEMPPEDGYHGEYVAALAARVVELNPGVLDLSRDDQLQVFRDAGYQLQLGEQRSELEEFRTQFDVWFSEISLHEIDEAGVSVVEHGFDRLREQGHLYQADGATWMRTTDFKDDKDRVLVKADGELTYFASDTAYYVNKRERGFDRCIYLLGADHHGYVGRLQAMAACVGDTPGEHLEVLIGQLVKIMQNGEELKLSKRAGTIVSLRELIDLIGVDPLRYTLSRYPVDSPLTLDVAEMTSKSNDNPVYYVQYAHARLSSILRNAADLGIAVDLAAFDAAELAAEQEGDLLRALAEFPRVVARAAELREPHRVARYLESTAAAFHQFYDHCRVLPQGDETVAPVHHARLVLVAATRQVIANGLALLGVSAPERM
ncbi:MAG TPA: arginine--tRNA ligase [Aeromicrobium sp.]|nr:arginine--tRNA ligase [Aeromicrobium sp.]HKY56919.1 arginine--tRNA ligase [Aeromicrobium sp.]